MSVLINQKDCLTVRKNLGLPDCILQEGRLTGFIIVPKGWAINLETDTFDKAYVTEQVQLGNFIPVLGAVEAINNTPEPTTEEYQGGVKSVVRNGLPEYSFKFLKGGWKFASALYTYNSFQAFDVLFVFSTGAIAGATNGTDFTGFDLGMLNNGTYMFTDGSVSASVTVMMQLVNETQFNRDVALLDASVLDFKVNTDILPITDIVMTVRADVSENKVYLKAKFSMNESITLMAIAAVNLRLFLNGATDVIDGPVVFNSLTSEYEIVPTTTLVLADKVVVQLYDSVAVADAAKIGNNFYKGTSNEATAVA